MSPTFILMPTYNERANIEHLIPTIFELHPDVSILVIDDNSPDRTADAVRQLMSRYKNLDLLFRWQKEGLGAAYKAGMTQVLQNPSVQAIITMDADGSHSPEYLASLIREGRTHDLVVGSRYVRGGGIEKWERWRRLLSRWGNFYSRIVTGLPVKDMTAGFMFINATLLRKIAFDGLHASGYAFLMELKWNILQVLQGRGVEVPIIFKSRREGESKISQHIIAEGLGTPWRIRFMR